MKRVVLGVLVGATLLPCACAQGLQPYRAVYTLSLARLKAGALAGASGTAIYRIRDLCTEWSVSQKLDIQIVAGDGSTDTVSFQSATLEDKAARHFRFVTVQTQNGDTISETSGEAIRRGGGQIVVHYLKPEGRTVILPARTMFPIQQTEALLAAAFHNRMHLQTGLFDGTSETGAVPTYATVGHIMSDSPPLDNMLFHGQQAVPVSVASFGGGEGTLLPDSAYSNRLWTNGIEDRLMIDFGDYVLSGHLDTLTAFPMPHCVQH